MAQSIEQLKTAIRGQLIQQEDAAYDAARRVYNGMIDKRPKLIVRAVDVGDVMAAVRYGRENGLLTAIRGGGHNGAGLGTCDGGLVIDLSPMTRGSGRPGSAYGARRGWMRLGRRGSCDPCFRDGYALRFHLNHWSCWTHSGRRHRLPDAPLWSHD